MFHWLYLKGSWPSCKVVPSYKLFYEEKKHNIKWNLNGLNGSLTGNNIINVPMAK